MEQHSIGHSRCIYTALPDPTMHGLCDKRMQVNTLAQAAHPVNL